ncbi:MAG: apolipoprotein N-acyltransferase [Candidatus Aminicenantes bacterium]|nr:apolipoprotein N-acyltransferase [Candidatus Aminicenantes bacterium]
MKHLRDFGLALLSGLLAALAFPKFNLSFLAWIALIPLLHVVSKSRPGRAFALSLSAGLSFYGLLLYWIPNVPAHYGGLSLEVSLGATFGLVLLLALFWGLFGLVLSRISSLWPAAGFILAPFIWTAQEYALTHVLTGFPWGLLGYSQSSNLWLIQAAAVTGVYGVSAVLVFFQGAFVYSFSKKQRTPFFIGLGVLAAFHIGGALSLGSAEPGPGAFRAAVIQGNVSSDFFHGQVPASEIREQFEHHMNLTRKAAEEGAELIVWPEFSVPLCFSCEDPLSREWKRRLLSYVRSSGRTLLVGTVETARLGERIDHWNAALALRPDQTWTEYHKMHLVPFGEYTPYPDVFGFVERMTQAVGTFTPGAAPVLHGFRDLRFGSPICYEIIFPNLVRQFVRNGAHFLATVTNDGWYGETSAPHQHFGIAVFRAVENRRFLLRAASTGVSGIVDPWGRVLTKSEIMTAAALTGVVTPSSRRTFYSRFGDVFALFGLTMTLGFFILSAFLGRHERQGKKSRQRIY